MTRIARQLPCRCGYDLRGRFVGDACPECGWLIDAPGASWCVPEHLRTFEREATFVRWSCLLLLIVPVAFVLGVVNSGDSGIMVALLLFAFLMPLQLIAQAIAVWKIAVPELGASRVRRLRVATLVRVGAFVLGSAFAIIPLAFPQVSASVLWLEPIGIASYFLIPLVAIACDFIVLRDLGSLRAESGVLVSGAQAIVPPIARFALIPVYFLLLVPFVGWFFAPIIWTVAVSIGFAQVAAVARTAWKALPE